MKCHPCVCICVCVCVCAFVYARLHVCHVCTGDHDAEYQDAVACLIVCVCVCVYVCVCHSGDGDAEYQDVDEGGAGGAYLTHKHTNTHVLCCLLLRR